MLRHEASQIRGHPVKRMAALGLVWTVAVGVGLGIWVATQTGVTTRFSPFVLLLIPCLAAGIGYWRANSLMALVIADVVLLATVVVLFLGGAGFLYLPALALFLAATVRRAVTGSE